MCVRARWALVAILVVAATACGGAGGAFDSVRAPVSESVLRTDLELPRARGEPAAGDVPAGGVRGGERVPLEGRLFGSREVGVLLSHTGSGDPGQTRVRRAADEGSSIEDQVRDVRVPMLFMTGAFDDDSAPLGAALERAAREPVEIVSLDTGEHGTDILRFGDPAVADRLRQTVLGFLAGF